MYTKLSRYISYLLRHHPEDLELTMDNNGWVNCNELVNKIHKTGKYIINIDILKQIVKEDDKQRYSFSSDGKCIRANQGHSIKDVDLQLNPVKPPDILLHGTNETNVKLIFGSGCISSMSRQYVHLSEDVITAFTVGSRHGGAPVALFIDCKKMYKDGYLFYKSENNVWLTNKIDLKYVIDIGFVDDEGQIISAKKVNEDKCK